MSGSGDEPGCSPADKEGGEQRPLSKEPRPCNAEDAEFEEADDILTELRRQAAAGESDLPWGSCVGRGFTKEGKLCVDREYAAGLGGTPLLLRELPYSAHPDTAVGVNGTGGVVWAGAVGLAELLRERSIELLVPPPAEEGGRGLLVLELGAGCGLVGLCVAALLGFKPQQHSGHFAGEARVVLSDENEAVLENLRHNAEVNRDRLGSSIVEVSHLEWEELLENKTKADVFEAGTFDLLLGSDVIWGHRGVLVGRMARRLVRPGGRFVLSSQEGRDGLPEFEEELRRADGEGTTFDVQVSRSRCANENLVMYVCRRLRQ